MYINVYCCTYENLVLEPRLSTNQTDDVRSVHDQPVAKKKVKSTMTVTSCDNQSVRPVVAEGDNRCGKVRARHMAMNFDQYKNGGHF